MELKHAKARIRPCRIVSSTMRGRPGGLPPERVVLVELPLEIVADAHVVKDETVRYLFPFADEVIKTIAGREEGDRRGADFLGRGHVADHNLTIHDVDVDDTTGRAPAFKSVVSFRGRIKLGIDELGEAVLHTKVRGYLTSDEVANLGAYVDADVWASLSMHLPLFDATEKPTEIVDGQPAPERPKAPKPTTAKRKGKTAADALGPHDVVVDGKTLVIGKKEVLRAEGAALNSKGRYSAEQVFAAARSTARLSAEPGADRIVVTASDIDDAIDALDAVPTSTSSSEDGADAFH